MNKRNEIEKSLQILLWIWFGTISSFSAVNVVNIAKLESKVESLEQYNKILNDRIMIIKLQNMENK